VRPVGGVKIGDGGGRVAEDACESHVSSLSCRS
jgi:hypothetical protein